MDQTLANDNARLNAKLRKKKIKLRKVEAERDAYKAVALGRLPKVSDAKAIWKMLDFTDANTATDLLDRLKGLS